MFFYLQLIIFFFFNYTDAMAAQALIIMFDFYVVLFYLSCYSYVRTFENGKYSFPIATLYKTPKAPDIFIMLGYFNKNIINNIRYHKYRIIDMHLYNKDNIYGISCDTLNLSFANKLPILSNNRIKNLIIDKNRFYEINNLHLPRKLCSLSAQMCSLDSVKIENLYLREIYLNKNELTNVNINCINLKKLFLSNNKINTLYLNCPRLKFLDLSDNQLESLESNLDLDVLNIENNQFIVLPTSFLNIKRLYLKGNPIIPNLNTYRWMEYFNNNYPEFFENNVEVYSKNVYLDTELVHNSHVSESIRRCIDELEEIYNNNNIKNEKLECISKIENLIVQNNFSVKNLISVILHLAKEKNLENEIMPIIEYEVEDGRGYCFSGKIGRIITAIMGFDLIKNVVTVSKNDEIMAKYDIVVRRLMKIIDESHPLFYEKLRKEFEAELVNLGIGRDEILDWVNEIKN